MPDHWWHTQALSEMMSGNVWCCNHRKVQMKCHYIELYSWSCQNLMEFSGMARWLPDTLVSHLGFWHMWHWVWFWADVTLHLDFCMAMTLHLGFGTDMAVHQDLEGDVTSCINGHNFQPQAFLLQPQRARTRELQLRHWHPYQKYLTIPVLSWEWSWRIIPQLIFLKQSSFRVIWRVEFVECCNLLFT